MKAQDETIPSQVKKPTQNPTIRWVFQMYEDVLLLSVKESTSEKKIVGNLTDAYSTVLDVLEKRLKKFIFQINWCGMWDYII